jgi:hypothetical protein
MIQTMIKALYHVGWAGGTQYVGVIDGNGSAIRSNDFGLDSARHPVSVAGTFRNLTIYSRNTTLRVDPVTVTLFVNGIASSLAVTLTSAATAAWTTGTDVSVSAGDDVCYRIVGSSTFAFGYELSMSIEFEGAANTYAICSDSGGYTVGGGDFGGALGNGALMGYTGLLADSNTYSICSVAGTITRLDLITFSGAPGTGVWTGYVRLNGVLQDGSVGSVDTSCVITGTDESAFSTFTLPIAIEDHVDLVVIRTVTEATFALSHVAMSIGFTPTTAGQYMLTGGSNDTIPSGTTAWKWNRSRQDDPAESQHLAPVGPRGIRARGLYIERSGAPGEGDAYRHVLRRNEADTILDVTIAHPDESGLVIGTVNFGAGDTIAIESQPINSPLGLLLYWGLALEALDAEDTPQIGVIGPIAWVEEWDRES